ncbi:hypothetical protein TCAL_04857 [Tigriopus californicus]|uniref:Thymosin beta n=1 Tax=Tigriopus californicus TaxID=6832 RepID=A0A553PT29_TIGCA|nr:thymosin beta-like [Tigriopus californicus]TRY80839.1 hypothetical protein TCAL_04857 [Tigriopus californicus]|eukprot:TCALIF_04857-PA protein Name:"Similar to TMSB4 Thymosin beta-4 (Oryctolagus cuniculus)" AED:0.05 eAED:0.05 QI:415/1/1/1/0.75/0.8/5/162/159
MSALKDLPNLQGNIKDEIMSPHKLKETLITEKNVLPTAEDVQQEKTHQGLIQGVEGFNVDQLNHVKTRQPATGGETLKNEIAYKKSCEAVSSFPKDNLKHVETVEKNPLPDKDAIAQEAEHMQFKQGIEKFDKDKLSNVETVEKNTLPSKEVIDQEKSA